MHTESRNKPFKVDVNTGDLWFIPLSSGKRRKANPEITEMVLSKINKSGCYTPASYHDLTFHASYIVAVVTHFERGQLSNSGQNSEDKLSAQVKSATENYSKENTHNCNSMPKNLGRISELGFRKVGQWHLVGEQLDFQVSSEDRNEKNVLYAFVTNGELSYIGKTTQSLKDRLQRYKTPAKNAIKGGSTNIKNNKNILAKLMAGESVEIYIFRSKEETVLSGFAVNFAAALEDSLINELRPPWNGRDLLAKDKTVLNSTKKLKVSKVEYFSRHLTADDFRTHLLNKIKHAESLGLGHIDILSGELHKEIGGYPSKSHSMPVCCSVMRGEMSELDEVLAQPPKGKGATLQIRYVLPR